MCHGRKRDVDQVDWPLERDPARVEVGSEVGFERPPLSGSLCELALFLKILGRRERTKEETNI